MSGIGIGQIKEKITSILKGEKTTLFLNNITKPLGNKTKRGMIISRQDGINCFLDNIFNSNDNDNESFLENNISNNCINNLIIKGKRIIVRTIGNTSNEFSFDYFGSNENINRILEKVKLKKDIIDYVLIILIDRNKPHELFRVCYNFYLKSMKDFSLNNDEERNWRIKSLNTFNFYINRDNLGEPLFTYSYNYE